MRQHQGGSTEITVMYILFGRLYTVLFIRDLKQVSAIIIISKQTNKRTPYHGQNSFYRNKNCTLRPAKMYIEEFKMGEGRDHHRPSTPPQSSQKHLQFLSDSACCFLLPLGAGIRHCSVDRGRGCSALL